MGPICCESRKESTQWRHISNNKIWFRWFLKQNFKTIVLTIPQAKLRSLSFTVAAYSLAQISWSSLIRTSQIICTIIISTIVSSRLTPLSSRCGIIQTFRLIFAYLCANYPGSTVISLHMIILNFFIHSWVPVLHQMEVRRTKVWNPDCHFVRRNHPAAQVMTLPTTSSKTGWGIMSLWR